MNGTKDPKEDFYKTLTWYFGIKTNLKGSILLVKDELKELNSNLKKTKESSTKLTKALNKLTLWGVVVAASGVLVGLLSLTFEVYKYFYEK